VAAVPDRCQSDRLAAWMQREKSMTDAIGQHWTFRGMNYEEIPWIAYSRYKLCRLGKEASTWDPSGIINGLLPRQWLGETTASACHLAFVGV
jgi:hypothetical protein